MVFGRGGLFGGKLCRFELVGMGEDTHWLGDLLEINFREFVHMLEIFNVSLKFQCAGRSGGQVFAQLNII